MYLGGRIGPPYEDRLDHDLRPARNSKFALHMQYPGPLD